MVESTEFLTSSKLQHVQAALGVPLNFTQSSSPVSRAFQAFGDYPRPGWLEDLAYLLDRGVKVTMLYGDRDYACNWIGGEAASLAINYSATAQFHAAGYEPIQTNSSYVGGLVRQFGNLSFSRIFQAGHEIPAWQPETALAVFSRSLNNLDIATGTKLGANYSSVGPPDTWETKSEIPEPEVMFCYVLNQGTCTDEQRAAFVNGSARVVRYVVEDANSTKLFPELFGSGDGSSGDGVPGGSTTSGASLGRLGGPAYTVLFGLSVAALLSQ